MNLMLLGALTMAAFIISLFFFRFWRETHDRFFLFFSWAFATEALTRIILGLSHDHLGEYQPFVYSIRLLSYMIIVVAVIDKNRRTKNQ